MSNNAHLSGNRELYLRLMYELKDYALISLGVILYSFGVTTFMLPYGLTTGGVAGISSIIYYATGIEVQVTYIIINILLLIAAIKILGVRFCLKTIYAVFFMTFTLWLMQRLLEVPDAANDGAYILPRLIGDESFMACMLGAIIEGIGLALCFENNGSTGGTDIIAAIVNKYRQVSLGSVIMACDVVIISSCYFVFHDWARVIYGFVMLFTCSITLDYCIRRQHQSVQFMIFSRNPDAIASAIVSLGHGVTMLNGEGWYTRTSRKVVVSVIRRREQSIVQRMVKSIDPYAFISLTDANSVYGLGFDALKVSESKENKGKRVLVFASNSTHKLAEARAIFGERYDIRSLADIGCYIDIPEKANSPEGNAMLKARFVKRYYGFDCVADDTILECEALNGMPGIYSRNYASIDEESMKSNANLRNMEVLDEGVSQEMLNILHSHEPIVDKPKDHNVKANVDKLLKQLEGKSNRKATLRTVLAFITGDFDDSTNWKIETFDGVLRGEIAQRATDNVSESYFYDSVFIPEGFDKCSQDLGTEINNQISQRSIAITKLKAHLDAKSNRK